MNLQRALEINTAALAVMGAIFLGLGHGTAALPLSLGLAAIASMVLSPIFPWLRLNRMIGNLIALGAVCWSMRDFLRMASQEQLLAIADMLIYLQIVLLFQEKSIRIHWQLVVLSLLQVVVAAALQLGPQFGALLALYMIMALSALVLLCLHRQSKPPPAPAAEPSENGRSDWHKLLAAPVVTAAESSLSELTATARPALIFRQVALLAGATLIFTSVFFMATPRLGEGSWTGARKRGKLTAGFSPEATLDEFGRIHQSNQVVMRVSLTEEVGRQPLTTMVDPYFTGAVLYDYVADESGSRWVRGPRRWGKYGDSNASAHRYTATSLVRQDIILETGNSPVLFAILPVQKLPDTPPDLRLVRAGQRIFRITPPDDLARREYRYVFGTPSLRNGQQLRGIPHHNPAVEEQDQFHLAVEKMDLTLIDLAQFPGLTKVAEGILRDQGLQEASELEKAKALERHFHIPGLYTYSVDLDLPKRNQSLDPIEDFVVNHRTGHCEYFAGALTMMLRSQGIPARMVVGYRGGQFNSLGKYYQVQQRNAHAWVEALIPPGGVPEWDIAGAPSGGGTWYRLDPTPASLTGESAFADPSLASRVGEAFDYVELLWRDYVLSLNASRQKDSIYDPMTTRAVGSVPGWMDSPRVRLVTRRLTTALGWAQTAQREGTSSQVFDWRTGLAAMLGLVVMGGLMHGSVLFWNLWAWRKRQVEKKSIRRAEPPAFYVRLESLLARLQLRRRSGQTPRELAAAAGTILNKLPAGAASAALPQKVVEAYYRVRFGGAALDKEETAAIEHALAQLVPAVQQAQS